MPTYHGRVFVSRKRRFFSFSLSTRISLNAFFSSAHILFFSSFSLSLSFSLLDVRPTHWERRCVDVDVDVDVAGGALLFKYKPKRRSGRLPVGASRRSWDKLARQKAPAGPEISARSAPRFVSVKSARLFQTRVGTVWHHPRRYLAANFTGEYKSRDSREYQPNHGPNGLQCISFISKHTDFRILNRTMNRIYAVDYFKELLNQATQDFVNDNIRVNRAVRVS